MSSAPALALGKKVQMVVTSGPNAGLSIESSQPLIQVGRAPENELSLSKDTKVSRHHLEIVQHANGLVVRNVSATNVALWNGQPIHEPTLIGHNGVLLVGDSEVHISLVMTSAIQTKIATAPSTAFQQQAPQFSTVAPVGKSKITYYVLAGVIVILAVFLFDQKENLRKNKSLRSSNDMAQELADTQSKVEELKKEEKQFGKDSLQYKWAQEYYLRGFRDYNQGQYGRAIQSLRAAVQVYPGHILARKYLSLAERRYDELLNFHLAQGRRYYGKGNYRLCISSYRSALGMIVDPKSDKFLEAQSKLEECTLRLGGVN